MSDEPAVDPTGDDPTTPEGRRVRRVVPKAVPEPEPEPEPAPTGVAKVTTSFWSEAEMQGGVTTDAPACADCLYQGRAVGS
mgnify:CR=1 FL=1